MESKFVNVGSLYLTTRSETVLVIDKGKFSTTTSSASSRKIKYKSLTLDVGRSWYFPNDTEKSKVVVVHMITHRISTVTGAVLKRELNEQQVRDFLVTHKTHDDIMHRTRNLNEQHHAFKQALAQLFTDVTRTSPTLNYREQSEPMLVLLRDPKFLLSILSLWLKYEQAQGRTVGTSESNPEDVLNDMADALTGLRFTQTRHELINEESQRTAQQEIDKHFHEPFSVEAA